MDNTLKQNFKVLLETMFEIGVVEIENEDLSNICHEFAMRSVFDLRYPDEINSNMVELLIAHKGQSEYDEYLKNLLAAENTIFGPEVRIYSDGIDLLKRLRNLGLVETYETISGEIGKYCRLSSKGLDISLKLQEHEDNKKRFNQQSKISVIALTISIFALVGLLVNISFSNKKLNESIKNTKINQKRLWYIEEQINNKKPKIIEINITKPIKAEIINPIDVNILQQVPDTNPWSEIEEPEC